MGIQKLMTVPVTVETFTSGGQFGDGLAAGVTDLVYVVEGLSLVQSSAGQQIAEGSSVLYARIANAAWYLPNSRVTGPNGWQGRVTEVVRHQVGSENDHVKVTVG